MIILTLVFLAGLVGVFEFLIFRQKNQYNKNLNKIKELDLKLGILRSLSYLLQSNQTLQEDWNQAAKILSVQNLYNLPPLEQFLVSKTNENSFDKSEDPQKNFSISVTNTLKLLIKKHEFDQKLTLGQQREAVSVKW